MRWSFAGHERLNCFQGKVSKMLNSMIDLYNCVFIQLFSSVRCSWTLFSFVLLQEFETLWTLIYDQLNIQYLLYQRVTHTHIKVRVFSFSIVLFIFNYYVLSFCEVLCKAILEQCCIKNIIIIIQCHASTEWRIQKCIDTFCTQH